VSLTDARFLNNVAKPFQDVITLKILDSPKPPSPAFYFEPMVNKTRLPKFTDLRPDHETPPNPRGRKMYLHLKPPISTPWETSKTGNDLSDQQATVSCIEKECEFQFKLAFDNLSVPELNALCYSLQPVPGFLHKLGMGKPLGLGSVELKVVAIRAVDRMQRYTGAGFLQPRFTKQRDGEVAVGWTTARAKEWRDSIEDSNLKQSLRALEIIGTTQVETMQYPMTRTQSDGEKELFEWPSKNQRLGPDYGQFMVPIENGGSEGLLNLPWNRRPWAFHLVGISDRNNQVQRAINSLPRGAASVKYVKNQPEAEKHIKTLDPYSVIFIVSANRLNWAGKITYGDVRYVPLSDLSKLTNSLNLRTP
jgi:hypothetical protein